MKKFFKWLFKIGYHKYLVEFEQNVGTSNKTTWIFRKKKIRALTHADARKKIRQGYDVASLKNISLKEIK